MLVISTQKSFSNDQKKYLVKLISFYINSYKLIEPPDGMWGGPNDDGTWNGMVGMVMRGVRLSELACNISIKIYKYINVPIILQYH